eukprot:gene372-679_t
MRVPSNLVLVTQLIMLCRTLAFVHNVKSSYGKIPLRSYAKQIGIRQSNLLNERPTFRQCTAKFLSTKADDDLRELSKPKTFGDKVKDLWKSYGYVAVGTYLGIYVTTLGSIYFCLDMDVFNSAAFGLDPVVAVKKVCDVAEALTGYATLPEYIRLHPQLGTFAIAWVMTKVTEPVRFAATVLAVPKLARVLGYTPNITSS